MSDAEMHEEWIKMGYEAGRLEMKEKVYNALVEAIKDGETSTLIQRLIRIGKFTEDEVHKAYKMAKE